MDLICCVEGTTIEFILKLSDDMSDKLIIRFFGGVYVNYSRHGFWQERF